MPGTDMLPSWDSQASFGFTAHGRTYRRPLQLASSVLMESAGLGLTTKAPPYFSQLTGQSFLIPRLERVDQVRRRR